MLLYVPLHFRSRIGSRTPTHHVLVWLAVLATPSETILGQYSTIRCPAKLLSPTRLSQNPRNFVLSSFVQRQRARFFNITPLLPPLYHFSHPSFAFLHQPKAQKRKVNTYETKKTRGVRDLQQSSEHH